MEKKRIGRKKKNVVRKDKHNHKKQILKITKEENWKNVREIKWVNKEKRE